MATHQCISRLERVVVIKSRCNKDLIEQVYSNLICTLIYVSALNEFFFPKSRSEKY